jgi:hypothetical protein
MALEAWGHRRIDYGEDLDVVIADILGDEEVPAAYLLVIVDLVLSHWPKSATAAIPFVGCPELLSLDRTRSGYEAIGFSFDFGAFGDKEPRGLATRESLKNRASRKRSLEQVVRFYTFAEQQADADALRVRLQNSLGRLGSYEADSSFSDPRLMASHILNQLDRANYQEQQFRDAEGNERTGYLYVPPEVEAKHLASMQAWATEQMAVRAQAARVLNEPEKSSPELIPRIVRSARQIDESGEAQPDYDHSVLIAAVLAMRDGDAIQREEHGAWAAAQFQTAISRSEDPVHRHRDALQFNPIGIATVGMVSSVLHGGGLLDARSLLELAARGDPAAAHGFGATMDALHAIDVRLPKSLLRCAFTGCIRPYQLRYDDKGGQDTARLREVDDGRTTAKEAEWTWLQGEGDEPDWPTFPPPIVHVREKRFIGGMPLAARKKPKAEAQFYADHQAAAIWLSKFLGRELIAPDWLRPTAGHYRDWTSALNGAGLDQSDELSQWASEWNSAYFDLAARSLFGLTADAIDRLCLYPVLCLPDEAFLDVMAELLPSLDAVYFNDKGLGEADAVRLRAALVERMEKTSSWLDHERRPGYGVERHLSNALAAVFLNSAGFGQAPRCYVTALGMPRAVPFIPRLADLAAKAPGLSVALMVLSIGSVSPDYPFLEFGVGALHA